MNALLAGLALTVLAQDVGSGPYERTRADDEDPLSACLYWEQPRVRFQQALGGGVTEEQHQAVSRAMRTWDAALAGCTGMRLEEGPTRTSVREVGYLEGGKNTNVVLFRDRACRDLELQCLKERERGDCGNLLDCWEGDPGVIALTTTTYRPSSGRILDSDVEMNAADFRFTTVDGPPCVSTPPAGGSPCVDTDVQNTMTHELGHAMGLEHTRYPGSVMELSAAPGETSKRELDPASVDFLCTVYPPDQPPLACEVRAVTRTLGLQHRGGGGCSAAGAGGPALALLALLGWRRRRAR